jgi:hypothetical protein
LADVLDQVLAAELGPAHLIKGLGLGRKTLQAWRGVWGCVGGDGWCASTQGCVGTGTVLKVG